MNESAKGLDAAGYVTLAQAAKWFPSNRTSRRTRLVADEMDLEGVQAPREEGSRQAPRGPLPGRLANDRKWVDDFIDRLTADYLRLPLPPPPLATSRSIDRRYNAAIARLKAKGFPFGPSEDYPVTTPKPR